MTTVFTILAIICIFGLPVPIVRLTRKNRILGAIGAITCCYLVGFAFSVIGFTGVSYDKGLTTTIAYVLVALSIPLILFSIDLRLVRKLTKMTFAGYMLCIVAVVIISFGMFFTTRNFFPSVNFSAMIVGLYTGGTPNMNAIGAAMGAESTVLSAANVSDTIVGGIYFLLLISVAPKAYRFLLKRRKKQQNTEHDTAGAEVKEAQFEGASDDFRFGISRKDKRGILKLVGAFFLAVLCLGIGVLLEVLIEGTVGENLLYILLSVSVLGVVLSFIRPVREVKGQYTLGMYLVLMLSLALSMSIDWSVFLTDMLPALVFFACAQVSVILLHVLLCKIFGVDGDTAIITSTAGVYGPPFIAPVAKAANRPDLIAPGVICGALGLAIGTLLGGAVGQILLLFV